MIGVRTDDIIVQTIIANSVKFTRKKAHCMQKVMIKWQFYRTKNDRRTSNLAFFLSSMP